MFFLFGIFLWHLNQDYRSLQKGSFFRSLLKTSFPRIDSEALLLSLAQRRVLKECCASVGPPTLQ